jgi:hypothetical protein
VTFLVPHALAQRRRVLFTMLTTLGYRYPPGREPAVIAGIRQYLGGWPGVGRIVAGMARQQYDLQLTRFGQDGWSATFYPGGIAHSLTPMVGSGWSREPWTAVQRAAWEALRRREAEGA